MERPPRQTLSAEVLARVSDTTGLPSTELMDAVYAELRALAGAYFRNERANHTLQPTALVHEAFAKVAGHAGGRHFENRSHFSALCAMAMRSILADHARRRRAIKRGGALDRVDLANIDRAADDGLPAIDALALDEALTRLGERSERQALIVEYRFFAGMTIDEVAEVLDVSRTTVEQDWRMARAWLGVQLRQES